MKIDTNGNGGPSPKAGKKLGAEALKQRKGLVVTSGVHAGARKNNEDNP